ncbi:MAG TPA: peptidoglycan-binding protein [Acidimicrobiia bacterium]|nr:peptidoglycan-binding protein [Acidimicrobiia bacterium]
MRLYRIGDSGEPIRDIQGRLLSLGFDCSPDPRGEFREGTAGAVRAFQEARGLDPDGIVGSETWRSLYEAGFRLGDRILYHRSPMLRGDDVEELQRRLNALGFDAGKIDGIFGPDTAVAMTDFQNNRGLGVDGIAGPGVIAELRLVGRATRKTGREAVREREWMRNLPRTLVGSKGCFDPSCRDETEAAAAWEAASAAAGIFQVMGGKPSFSRSVDIYTTEPIRARRANRIGADFIVSLRHPQADDPGVYFFATPRSRSEAGALLASEIAGHLDLPTGGRAAPILKHTRSPAVVVAHPRLGKEIAKGIVAGINGFFVEAANQE